MLWPDHHCVKKNFCLQKKVEGVHVCAHKFFSLSPHCVKLKLKKKCVLEKMRSLKKLMARLKTTKLGGKQLPLLFLDRFLFCSLQN